MKRPSTAVLASVMAMLAWLGMRYLSVPDVFGALAPSGGFSRTDAGVAANAKSRHQPAAKPDAASVAKPPAAARAPRAKLATMRAASSPEAKALAPDEAALARTAREKLAALRAPLSPEAQSDPFSVLSWLPPPPPPAPVAEVVKAPPPVAPPLPFTFVGMSNADQAKPQVFLANGDQLLIVSPGDVIDGRYRFESIAATAAVFTYLPLEEKQVMTIDGEGK